ncbi:MAG: hypothetical protein R3Y28_01230 [Candidatus Gastranaerophilales bacterium]
MVVKSVGHHNENTNPLTRVIGGTVIGTTIGYGLKYALPLTPKENDFDKKAIINSSRKNANAEMVYEIKKQTARKQGLKNINSNTKLDFSPAQDTFIKIIENKKGNTEFTVEKIAETVKKLEAQKTGSGKEYQNIMKSVDNAAKSKSTKLLRACKLNAKKDRNLAAFIIPTATIGLLAGAFINAIKASNKT